MSKKRTMSKDTIYREDAIMALRLEYPMMPFFKESREEWAIKTEGYRKAEEVIMKLPSVDTPTTMTEVIDAIREAEYRGCMKAVEERPKGEWASVLAELHDRFNTLEKEIRKASAEMSAIIREYVDGQKGEPQTIIGERFPSYITENNTQVLDGWQTNPRTSTTAVEDEPQTVLEAVLERQTDEDRRKMEESIRKAIKDEPQTAKVIGCSKCSDRFWCTDRDMPHAVHCNNYGKSKDEQSGKE